MTWAKYPESFQPYTWTRIRRKGDKYKKRRELNLKKMTPDPFMRATNWNHIILNLSFYVGRHLTLEEEGMLLSIIEQGMRDAVVLTRWCEAKALFNDGEMLHVRVKINNTPHMLRAYMKRTEDIGDALSEALKEFDRENVKRRSNEEAGHD